MRASLSFDRRLGQVRLDSRPDENDPTEKYTGVPVHFTVPPDWVFEATHPDLLALVAILCLSPFVGDRLSLNLAVSDQFRAACTASLPFICAFDDSAEAVAPRPTGSVPGLSFSGGVDSTAALAVMPKNTIVFFLDRTPDPSGARTLYVKESAEVACRMVAERGYTVHMVDTNLERIRRPVGFPVDWSSGAPAVLLADHCDLSSISWGMVAESGYRVGHEKYLEFGGRAIFFRWNRLMSAVGLGLGAPVAGLSEVATSMIALRSSLVGVSQSCIRGRKDKPCLNCAKCFRMQLLETALMNDTMDVDVFDRMIRFRGGEQIALALPIKHENVYRWAVEHLTMSGSSPTWEAFSRRLRTRARDVSWAAAWYPPSAAFIPPEFRDFTIGQIRTFVPDQTLSQQEGFESWDLSDLNSPDVKIVIDELDHALRHNKTLARAAQAWPKLTRGTSAPPPPREGREHPAPKNEASATSRRLAQGIVAALVFSSLLYLRRRLTGRVKARSYHSRG